MSEADEPTKTEPKSIRFGMFLVRFQHAFGHVRTLVRHNRFFGLLRLDLDQRTFLRSGAEDAV